MIVLLLALTSQALAQVGPAIAPDTTNPAGDVELGVSGSVVGTLVGFSGSTYFDVLGGPGVHGDWSLTEWFTVSSSVYGLGAMYSNSQDGMPSGHGGFVGLDLGVPLGATRVGIWTTGGSLGTPTRPSAYGTTGGFMTGLALGPSLRWTDPQRRVSIDAHPSLLLCNVGSGSDLELECPMYDDDVRSSMWLLNAVSSSEFGVDLIVNDRDSVRFAMTSLAPTIGWKGRFDYFDVSVLWGSALAVVSFLQLRIDTHPLQWKHRHERDDPDSTWVERPAR